MSSYSHVTATIFKILFDLKDRQLNPYVTASASDLKLDRASLDLVILKRLKTIVEFASTNSIHYKNKLADWNISYHNIHSLEDFKIFPKLTREDLKHHLDEVTVVGRRDAWVQSATGGTTSSPVPYYRDRLSSLRREADKVNIDTWFGRRLGDRVAYLWGAPQDFSSSPTIGMRLRNLTYQKSIMLPSAPLDDSIMGKHLRRLNEWQPTFLQAYPTPLYEFCLFLKRTGNRLPYLKNASVTAEPLYEHQRNVIEEVLGFRLFNWYGSRELGRVASECEYHDGLHINEPSVYVEVEPDPSLPDGFGHLIVTDLWNKATPFIRYETGDVARFLDGPCKCGRALKRIAGIEGRLVDTIKLPGGRKVPGVSLTNRVIKDWTEIAELQVIQKTKDLFLLRYVKGPKFSTDSLEVLAKNLKTLLDTTVTISFEELTKLPRSSSGKVRFVISEAVD